VTVRDSGECGRSAVSGVDLGGAYPHDLAARFA